MCEFMAHPLKVGDKIIPAGANRRVRAMILEDDGYNMDGFRADAEMADDVAAVKTVASARVEGK